MGERRSLCRVETDAGNFYLLTTLHGDGEEGFDLAMSDGERAWTGTVLDGDLEMMSNKAKMRYDDLVGETKMALTGENVGSFNFVYQAKESGEILTFVWKKLLATDNIKVQLGTAKLKLKDEPTGVIKMIFEQAIRSTETFNKRISNMQTENFRLDTERKNALKKYETCVKAKEELEGDLYEKFVTVLNDKKAKIRDMRDEIEDLRSGVPSTSATSVTQTQNSHRDAESSEEEIVPKKKAARKRSSVSDEEYDTDDEKKQKTTASPTKKSKPNKVLDSSQDSSLILDTGISDDDESSKPAPRRRRRGQQAKTTPAKPVIPKVPSSEGKSKPTPTRQSSSRGSMRKSSSQLSKSSEDLDPDNLLNDIYDQM